MIRSIGEMLQQLRQAEADRLGKSDIRHAPTIGAMYEGLTKDVLNEATRWPRPPRDCFLKPYALHNNR